MEKTKQSAIKWIEEGNPVVYRHGWGWKGARHNFVTKEWALEHIKPYDFGIGFYELSWISVDGNMVLEMNELSENDMW